MRIKYEYITVPSSANIKNPYIQVIPNKKLREMAPKSHCRLAPASLLALLAAWLAAFGLRRRALKAAVRATVKKTMFNYEITTN